MSGIIVSIPPLVEQPPGSSASNPAGLPGVNYVSAVLSLAQTWTAKQTFPLGEISLYAADIIGLGLFLQSEQHITGPGPIAVNNDTGIVRVDQAVGAPMVLTMPLSSAKTCPVLISDFKGDAGTNNITINLSGSDTFPGGLTSWTIAADAGSVFLRPISGVGYVL